MKTIRDLKIKNKLIAIILVVTVFTLVIASVFIIVLEKKTRMDSLKREIGITAKLTSDNLAALLDIYQFQDSSLPREEVEKILVYLKKVDVIKNAYAFNNNGNERGAFAQSEDYKMEPPIVLKKAALLRDGILIHVYEPIVNIENQQVGMLYLRVSTEKMDRELANFTYLMLLLMLVLIAVSVFLANKLQGIISNPVLHLVNVTREISMEGDFTIQVNKWNDDEIGMLYDAFNEMMEQILNRNIERDQVEARLKSAQFFLASVIESMPSLLVAIEEDGAVTQWNQSTAALTGVPADEARGKIIWELLPDFAQFRRAAEALPAAEGSVEFYKKSIRIKGSTYYFNGSIFPLLDGEKPKFVFMLSNVTDIELKERQLRQSQKMETVGNLAGGLAHDFNNVLGGIIGTISLYKYKVSKNKQITGEESEKYFNTIEDAANRASDMVQHLLSLTRKQELSFTPTDLNKTIANTVRICKNTFDKSIDISTEYFKDRAMTNADPTQVEQALLNLCINASHAMTIMRENDPTDGGKLAIAVKKLTPDKFFRELHDQAEDGDYWDISVSDTGVGMDQKTVARIFDPFFTTKRAGSGTGLGLAMVYNIIKQHKGFIDVYSQEGLGTTFHLFLPALPGDVSEIEKPDDEAILSGEGLILVVDDEEVMRQTAKSILLECGYEVLLADNGQEAVDIYKIHNDDIHAVLLDMVMPKMSGRQTYIELKKIDENVKVLLVSGFKQDHRVESILELGVRDFLQKPYTLMTLANRMHKIIKG